MQFDKRKSGIALIGDIPWGSHFCLFYQAKKDLLEILAPYFKAGLENNEFCVWVISAPLELEDAKGALKKAMPDFEKYAKSGQVEILPYSRWRGSSQTFDTAVDSALDRGISRGFDCVRFGFGSSAEAADAISRHNAIAAFAYPRDEFDAMGLMKVVKKHRLALVRNAARWEVIESSEARVARNILKRSEEKLQSIFSNMSEGFAYCRIVLDAKGEPCDAVFLEVNKAFYRLTGYKEKDITGKRVTQALPGVEKDPANWVGRFGEVALTGKPLHFESYSETLKRWYIISAFTPHKGYFAAIFNDITERRRAGEKIRHLASFPQRNPNPIIELDEEGKIIFSNLAAIRVLKQLKAAKQIKLFLPEDFAQILKAFKSGKDKEVIREIRIREKFFIETLAFFPELKVVRIYAQDITGRKEAEELLKETYDELEAKVLFRTQELVQANRSLVEEIAKREQIERQIAARNAMLKLLNRAASRKQYADSLVKLLKGWSGCRCAGIRLLDYEGKIPYESYAGFSSDFWESENWLSVRTDNCACTRVISQKGEAVDIPFMSKAGSFYCNDTLKFFGGLSAGEQDKFRGVCVKNGFCSVAVIPIRHKDKVLGAIHLADEEPDRLRPGVREFIEMLSELIGEGVNKFNLEEGLSATRRELEQARRLSDIGTLAATVAHELRNPLAAINMAASNIRRKANNPDLERHLFNIEKKVTESDQIISNLLFYSRIKPPHCEIINLSEIISDCIDGAQGQSGKKISVEAILDPIKDIPVSADPLQMKEVFSNILNNASDAVPDSSGRIEIAAADADRMVKVSIRDNGCGIDKFHLDKVFDPFFTTKAKGTGLGLAVCNQIVAFHKGSITIESELEKGTTVTVCLPKK